MKRHAGNWAPPPGLSLFWNGGEEALKANCTVGAKNKAMRGQVKGQRRRRAKARHVALETLHYEEKEPKRRPPAVTDGNHSLQFSPAAEGLRSLCSGLRLAEQAL